MSCNLAIRYVCVVYWGSIAALAPQGQVAAQFREPPTLLSRFVVGSEAVCPTAESKLVKDRFRNVSIYLNQGFGYTYFVNFNRGQAFENAFPTSPAIEAMPGNFRRVFIMAQSESGKRWLVKWDEHNESGVVVAHKCAWISRDAFLGVTNKVTPRDLKKGPPVVRVRDMARLQNPDSKSINTLALKVVISNLNQSGDDGVPVYASPNTATPFDKRRLLELYAVYDVDDEGNTRNSNNPVHFLIGKDEAGASELTGWVHQEDVYEWNSRMAVFGNAEGIETFVKGSNNDGNTQFVRNKGVQDIPFNEYVGRSRSRFPVLQTIPDAPNVKSRVTKLREQGAKLGPLEIAKQVDGFQVVLPIQNCNVKGANCLSSEQYEKERRKYQALVDSLNNVDIILLMDATESMDQYFPATADAVIEFSKKTLSNSQITDANKLRVKTIVYGDYQKGRALVDEVYFKTLSRWHFPSRETSALNDMRVFAAHYKKYAPKDREIDKFEGSLAAIVRAANSAGWREEAGFRMIVHLADHGSRPLGEASGQNGSTLKESISVQHAVSALAQNKVLYVPIAVVGRAGKEDKFAQKARTAFNRQATQIQKASGIRAEIAKSYRVVGEAETDADRELAVFNILGEVWRFTADGRDIVRLRERCAESPKLPRCELLIKPSDSSTPQARINNFLDEKLGLSKEQIGNIYSRRDNAIRVWLKPLKTNSKGKLIQALSYWVAIDASRFSRMADGFRELCRIIEIDSNGGDISSRIVRAFKPLIGELAGEGNTDFYRSKTFATMLSLPFVERSDYLSLSPADIEDTVDAKDENTMRNYRGAFCRTAFLLEKIVAKSRIYVEDKGKQRPPKLSEMTLNDEGFVIGKGDNTKEEKEYEWLVKIDRGEGVYYLPFEYLP